ncbi:unnamed protein product [Didymodactylos carnosus]|uniref:Helitron helicase-like domain-containing protein n=2 Tax=Didymodactylos carnosus TaxID=1234261 RepID=A0A815KI80_9BILA|nr:unnamed protein product [Didymodactylos carnosus]CAF4286018.1 unnamed protein product [Didymodactylos carnosus]
MDQVWEFCAAKKWKGETPGMCCSNGKVLLLELREPPDVLTNYMSNNDADSIYVKKNLRLLNNSLQMTSFGTIRSISVQQGFSPTFKIQGQVYHRAGSLLPLEGEDAKFLQTYFMGDEQSEVDKRLVNNPGVRRDILPKIQQMLHLENKYVRDFKNALDHMPQDDMQIMLRADRTSAGEHERRFNAPVLNKVAIVIEGNEFELRDIMLHKRNNQLQRISETHKSYDALQYPIIFSRGEDGYYISIKQVDPTTKQEQRKTVSAKDFYAYRIMVTDKDNHFLNCRQLFSSIFG